MKKSEFGMTAHCGSTPQKSSSGPATRHGGGTVTRTRPLAWTAKMATVPLHCVHGSSAQGVLMTTRGPNVKEVPMVPLQLILLASQEIVRFAVPQSREHAAPSS